jgi:hypothetical protein
MAATASLLLGDWPGLPLTMAFALPIALVMAFVFEILSRVPVISAMPTRVGERLTRPLLLILVLVGLFAFSVGFYLSNRFLTDEVLGPQTRVGYLISLVATGLGLLWVRRALRRNAPTAWFGKIPRWAALTATLVLVGYLGVVVDLEIIPGRFPRLHVTAFVGALATMTLAAAMLVRRLAAGWLLAAAALEIVFVVVPREQAITGQVPRLAGSPWAGYWQLYQALERALDEDGDGYSLLGGDCDEADPRAYPLSYDGRDCLGWVSPGASPLPKAPLLAPSPAAGPPIVVLVTIDSFRCGFGVEDREELRDVCPNLTAMARSGRARLDTYTRAPNTSESMAALHLGTVADTEPAVADLLGRAGYRTHAIVTHQVLISAPSGLSHDRCAEPACRIRRSFHSIDDSLVPLSAVPNASSAAAVTDRGLAWLRQAAQARDQKVFLWMHYYDPHAPYARKPGAVFVWKHVESYAAEVRRTDQEIGRFLEGVSALGASEGVLMLVTADHGEEFGLHRRVRHGLTLYQQAVRVPFIAWSPGPNPGRFVTAPLPTTLLEFRHFLLAIIGGVAFNPAADVTFFTRYHEDPQVGILSNGWKLIHHLRLGHSELYDLASDPLELDDKALESPARVLELGKKLGSQLRDDPGLQTVLGL